MNQQNMYFRLEREADFKRGFCDGTAVTAQGLTLCGGDGEGVYFTRVFDSRERQTEWHRIVIEGEWHGEATATVCVYASDTLYPGGGTQTVEELIGDSELTAAQKARELRVCLAARFYQPKDMLLYDVRGRYLWLKLELKGLGGNAPGISRITIRYPKHTWLSFLPELYQEDRKSAAFLERYLSIFQSLYEDMTEKIEQAPRLLEPSENGFLGELADWLGVRNQTLWNEDQLCYLVKNAARLHRIRGTAACLKELAALYLGSEPYLVEYHQIKPYFDGGEREETLKRLYASGPYEFAVILNVWDLDPGSSLRLLEQVIAMAKPAYMACRIVVLKPYLFLGRHSYLGINSVLGQYTPLRLDGISAIPFSVLEEKTKTADSKNQKTGGRP